MSFRRLLLLTAAAVLLIANTASAQTEQIKSQAEQIKSQTEQLKSQTERIKSASPTDTVIRAGAVTEKSAAVDLKAVGKEVAPGLLEVDADSVHGKRLVMPRGEQAARAACIGKWKNGECKGIYIEW